ADHAAVDHRGGLFVLADRGKRESLLRLPAVFGDRHVGRVCGAGFLPLLHLLGNYAGADVFPHWHLGGWTAPVLGYQILLVYSVWLGVHALRYFGALLFQWKSRLWNWQAHL